MLFAPRNLNESKNSDNPNNIIIMRVNFTFFNYYTATGLEHRAKLAKKWLKTILLANILLTLESEAGAPELAHVARMYIIR